MYATLPISGSCIKVSSASRPVPGRGFLDLPAELRNAIYELAACTSSTFIYDCGLIASPNCALACVSKQIREEYLPILHTSAAHATRCTKLRLRTKAFHFNGLRDFLHNELNVFPRAREPDLEITLLMPRPESRPGDGDAPGTRELRDWLCACQNPHLPASRTYQVVFDWSTWDRASARCFADAVWTETWLTAGSAALDSVRLYTAMVAAIDGPEMLSVRALHSSGTVVSR